MKLENMVSKSIREIFYQQEDDVLPLFEDYYKPYKVKEHGYMTEYAGRIIFICFTS